jgi:hypothetical protein
MANAARQSSLYDDENDEDLKAAINDLSLRSQRKEIRKELTDP